MLSRDGSIEMFTGVVGSLEIGSYRLAGSVEARWIWKLRALAIRIIVGCRFGSLPPVMVGQHQQGQIPVR